jgi:hypothetical protein
MGKAFEVPENSKLAELASIIYVQPAFPASLVLHRL